MRRTYLDISKQLWWDHHAGGVTRVAKNDDPRSLPRPDSPAFGLCETAPQPFDAREKLFVDISVLERRRPTAVARRGVRAANYKNENSGDPCTAHVPRHLYCHMMVKVIRREEHHGAVAVAQRDNGVHESLVRPARHHHLAIFNAVFRTQLGLERVDELCRASIWSVRVDFGIVEDRFTGSFECGGRRLLRGCRGRLSVCWHPDAGGVCGVSGAQLYARLTFQWTMP